ncbi:MAG: hypothetical protein IBX68_01355 [Dehalococcoidia bacterium]|nr:hypothetical protein [Dehalococcoidia bacterium]
MGVRRGGGVATIVNIILVALLAVLFLIIFTSYIQRRQILVRRMASIRRLERKRSSRVITMIHRRETMSFLGFPITRYIDIEDSEQVLRAIRMTRADMPIDLVMHTPGGLVLASEQIACALRRHEGKVTVFVPHYAMSGGTLVALAADEIVMDTDAVLGPVDPQIGSPQAGYFPAASILKALEQDNPNRDDHILILGDMARKGLEQVRRLVFMLVRTRMAEEEARRLADSLSQGRWTHDYPISYEQARELGLPVSDSLPGDIHELMELYPQPGPRRTSVEYIPMPYRPPGRRPRHEGRQDYN